MKHLLQLVVCLLQMPARSQVHAQDFLLVQNRFAAMIVYGSEGPFIDSIAANLLADEFNHVTQLCPPIITALAKANGNVVVIGSAQSRLVKVLFGQKHLACIRTAAD